MLFGSFGPSCSSSASHIGGKPRALAAPAIPANEDKKPRRSIMVASTGRVARILRGKSAHHNRHSTLRDLRRRAARSILARRSFEGTFVGKGRSTWVFRNGLSRSYAL